MFRTILEFLTQRALDNGTPVPAWLRKLQKRDAGLQRYADDAQELDQLLRTSAVTRRHELVEKYVALPLQDRHYVANVSYNTHRYRQIGWIAVAAAACVLIATFGYQFTQQSADAQRARVMSAQLAAVPDEMLALFAEAAQVPREFSPLSRISLPEFNVWSDIPRGTQSQLRKSLDGWTLQITGLGEGVYERLDLRAKFREL